MRSFLFVASCILILVSFTGVGFSETGAICNTWVNMDYDSGNPPQKLIRNQDGTFQCYISRISSDPCRVGTFNIVKKWKDAAGNIWYRINWVGHWGENGCELARISNDGKTLEYVFSKDEFPARINPKDANYRIYTRD